MNYFLYGRYSADGGDLRVKDDANPSLEWHFNSSPQKVFEDNIGNCGDSAGLVAYLLDGDYEQVGIVGMTFSIDDRGGHVVNYIYDGKFYCIFDPVNLVSGGYTKQGMNFSYGKTLAEATKRWCENTEDWNEVLMYAYESSTGDAPVGWDNGQMISWLISGYSDNVQILLENPEQGYVYKTTGVSAAVLDAIARARNSASS